MLPHCFCRRMASMIPSHRHHAVSGRYQNVSVSEKKKSHTKSETFGNFRSVHSSNNTAAADSSEPYKTETANSRRASSMYKLPRNNETAITMYPANSMTGPRNSITQKYGRERRPIDPYFGLPSSARWRHKLSNSPRCQRRRCLRKSPYVSGASVQQTGSGM